MSLFSAFFPPVKRFSRRATAPCALAFGLGAGLFALVACTPSKKDLGDVYRGSLVQGIKGFDPAHVSDLYSHTAQKQVYESLYEYHYLKRPYTIQPSLASELPEISEDGRVYLIRLREDVRFTDNEAFSSGKGRKVVAEDFVFSVKRIADVRNRSTGWWLFDEKIVGLNAFREQSEKMDLGETGLYDLEVEGLLALDDSTIRIELTQPFPYFKYILTMGYAAVVAREVVEHYGPEFLNHPVGTGPYVLTEWRRGLKLKFRRNPQYRETFYPSEGERDDSIQGLLADAGKVLPLTERLELNVYVESQPMWLNFLRGNIDYSSIPKDNYAEAITPDRALRPEFRDKGIQMERSPSLDLTYITFNFAHPILGEHKALRQAMSLATNTEHIIELFYNGRAIPAHGPIPPGIFGYDEDYEAPYSRYDTAAAFAKLEEAGFPRGEGLPVFEYLTVASTSSRQMAEHFAQDMRRVGIEITIASLTWPEFLNRLKNKKYEIGGLAWAADYPDPENFLQLLYGPNEAPGENSANYKNAEYDSLFREMAVMQDSPERLAIIRRMVEIVTEEIPWIFNTHRISEALRHSWLYNVKPHSVDPGNYKYFRVAEDEREQMLLEHF